MDKGIIKIIERFKEALLAKGVSVSSVVLFGSQAVGKIREHIDIDIVVISDDFKDMNILQRMEVIGEAMADARIFDPIEAFPYTEEEYAVKKAGSFVGDDVKPVGIRIP